MNFSLNEDQLALQQGIRDFCDQEFPVDKLAALEKEPVTRERWKQLAEMGVFSLRLPEAQGGVGLGMAEAVLVFAELGRRLVPGPLVWTHLAAGAIDGAASGDAIVGGLDDTHPTNRPQLVEHAGALDAFVLLRRSGLSRAASSALAGRDFETPLDPLTPMRHVAQLPAGAACGDAAAAARWRRDGALLTAAFQLGIAETSLELAVEYAKKREQFDRPIAGFQAIKHFAADMHVRVELARAAVYAAGATCDDAAIGDPQRAASAARVVAGEAALKNARMCIQIYGGMGFTWEMPPHYFLKRALVLEHAFGTVDDHSAIVAESAVS
ncbi:MAG: acyl-CoA/acyl-ACP dehydrogenase [Deltaproteobacteria bacterium]|nr:acyl-CoA/acyl-ACP dehydrogenase [Deltaproteobacteria bacterium]